VYVQTLVAGNPDREKANSRDRSDSRRHREERQEGFRKLSDILSLLEFQREQENDAK